MKASQNGGVMARRLGSGLEVSTRGLGCMGVSGFYGAADRQEAVAMVLRALGLGVTFLDTADVDGRKGNEELIGEAISGAIGSLREARRQGHGIQSRGYRGEPMSMGRRGRTKQPWTKGSSFPPLC